MSGAVLPASLEIFVHSAERAAAAPDRGGWGDWTDEASKIELRPTERRMLAFPNTAVYSPIPYAPQALALCVGRLLDAVPLALLYTARIANLLASVGLVALGSLGLVVLSRYIIWTPVGADFIEGTQGRHFYPISAFAAWLLHSSRGSHGTSGWPAGLAGLAVLVSVLTTWAVVFQHYH